VFAIVATPALAQVYNELGQILVCTPSRPHMHHFHVAHAHVRFIGRPTLRAHHHHKRVCHAHVHCHWEDMLGGPAGGGAAWGGEPILEADTGEGDFGALDGGFGGGGLIGGSDVLPELILFTPLVPITPLIPSTPTVPITPVVAVPEPSTWILMLAGLSALGFLKWRRA